MASIVADYGSDDESDQNSDDSSGTNTVQSPSENQDAGKNYLMAADEDDSDSDEEKCKSDHTDKSGKLPNPLLGKLPKPHIGKVKKSKKEGIKKTFAEASVFTNQYEKAEMAKQSILEKHVKMTEGQNLSGRKICKKFKMGKCRFGKNCKYSHELDTLSYKTEGQEADSQSKSGNDHSSVWPPGAPRLPPPPRSQGFMGTLNTLNRPPQPKYTQQQMAQFRHQEAHMQSANPEDDDDNFVAGDKRKKRVGLSQSLVPPKKAMSALSKQRQEERPWTVHRK